MGLFKYTINWLLTFCAIVISATSHAGIDLYSGSLAMYYTDRWETLAAKWAKKNGCEYKIIRPTNQNKEKAASDEDILDAARIWKDTLVKSFKEKELDIKNWNESLDSEYNTIQVSTKFYDYIDDYEETTKKNLSHLKFEFWIPSEQGIIFEFTNLQGKYAKMGTTGGIIYEINELSEYYFNENIETLSKKIKSEAVNKTTESNTHLELKLQLSEIYDLSIWSLKNGFPMILSY
ncbi:MAG TPA: hypothetical protein VGU44_01150 [Gammaproteobacteria bacterium]|nr:hypothetical protein [Gammaproteobacteria bacterium]